VFTKNGKKKVVAYFRISSYNLPAETNEGEEKQIREGFWLID